MIVRTRDIWLLDDEDKKRDLRSSTGYEEYVFPLFKSGKNLFPQSNQITTLLSIYQDHREKTLYAYKTLGLSTIPINMERKNIRNSFSGTFDYPRSDIISLVKSRWSSTPEAEISAAIAFFRKSTYVYSGKSQYDKYLDCVESLFSCLYKIDIQYFTALYKLSLPIEPTFQGVIKAFDDCIANGDAGYQWADSIIPDFEWFSVGQHQIALMFSGLYQRLKSEYEDESAQDLILMLDEPETHMHPEAGRHFIETLNVCLTQFRSADLIRNCQIILATHSPFLIQSLSNYPASIALTENDHGQITITDFINLQNLHLPDRQMYSFNLVMYHVFHVPTTELHDELYGYLQESKKCYREEELDKWLLNNTQIEKTKSWISVIDGKERAPMRVTLQRYIRNFIHHPENIKNQEYTPAELRQSIEEMLALI